MTRRTTGSIVRVSLTWEMASAARKHGIEDRDIVHAWTHAIR
jgi:hypothetical protein